MEGLETVLLQDKDRLTERLLQLEEQLRIQEVDRQLRATETQELRTLVATLQVICKSSCGIIWIRIHVV